MTARRTMRLQLGDGRDRPEDRAAKAVSAPSRTAGPPLHQFRGFSLDTVIRDLSNMCPREVADGKVTLTWEIPLMS